jgi:hypothetical protein
MAVSKKYGKKRDIKAKDVFYNPSTGNYVVRDVITGRYLIAKNDSKIQKIARKSHVIIKPNPSVKKVIALKAEKSVLSLMNKRVI